MSLTFGWIDGVPYDFHYKVTPECGYTTIYLGEVLLCRTFKDERTKAFSVVVYGDLDEGVPKLLDGFRTRWDAMMYALKVHKSTKATYNR